MLGLLEATAGGGGLVIQSNVNNGTGWAHYGCRRQRVSWPAARTLSAARCRRAAPRSILDSNSATLGTVGGTITNTGTVTLQDGTTLTLLGTILNDKVISLNNYDYNTDLIIGSSTAAGTTTLSGGGTISLDQYTGNRIYAALARRHAAQHEQHDFRGRPDRRRQ